MSKMNIVALGAAACSVADRFKIYPEYRVYKIDTMGRKDKYSHRLPVYKSPEEYEKYPPKLKTFFRLIQGNVLFIVSGASRCSSASLVILEQIKHCKISVLYIKPDLVTLNEKQEMMHRVSFGVLQEYARSGVFEKIYLIDNAEIEKLMKNVSLEKWFPQINETIASTLHWINVFNNSKSVLDNLNEEDPNDIKRIISYGFMDIATGYEQLFFPLDNIEEKSYYYGVNEKEVVDNDSLFLKIKEQLREKKEKGLKSSYGIWTTDHKANFALVVAKSSKVQRETKE